MNQAELTCIRIANQIEANVIVSLLADNNIQSFIHGGDHYHALGLLALVNDYQVMVAARDVDTALNCLASAESAKYHTTPWELQPECA